MHHTVQVQVYTLDQKTCMVNIYSASLISEHEMNKRHLYNDEPYFLAPDMQLNQ